MRRIFLILSLMAISMVPLLAQSPGPPVAIVDDIYTPDSSIRYATGDVLSLPVEIQPYIRYLSLYNIPKDRRGEVAQTVSFVINSLSTRKKIYLPVFVGASNETLIRINLKDYDIKPSVFDEMGRSGSGPKPTPEPYFHAFVEKVITEYEDRVIIKTKKVATGRYYQDGSPEYKTEKYEVIERAPTGHATRKKELMSAPWLDATSLTFLCKATRTEFPVFRADWFIVNATMEPIYHKMLGLGEDEKSFDKAIFADEALAKRARSQAKGVVIKSGVARNNRTLLRSPTFTGGYRWESNDSLTSTSDRNYVQNMLNAKFDAKEIIATLPNGLQVYFVTDDKGKRLDKADNEIATDYMAADKIVRNGRSCIYCHAAGINPIQDEIRILNKKLTNREQVALLVTDPEDAYKIEDLFGSDLDRQIVRDQQIYADAIGLAVGTTSTKNAEVFHAQWEGYTEGLMTVQQIARDCGLTMRELENYCRLSNDNLFLGLVKQPIRPVRRDQFEQAYQTFMIMVMQARAGTRQTLVPKSTPMHKATGIRKGDEIITTRNALIYKSIEAEEPCAQVRANTQFTVLRSEGDMLMIRTQLSGLVYIRREDVSKVD